VVSLIKYELLQLREQFLIFTEFPFHSHSETKMWHKSTENIGEKVVTTLIFIGHKIND